MTNMGVPIPPLPVNTRLTIVQAPSAHPAEWAVTGHAVDLRVVVEGGEIHLTLLVASVVRNEASDELTVYGTVPESGQTVICLFYAPGCNQQNTLRVNDTRE